MRRTGRRDQVALIVLALPALLASLELTVTHLALPALTRDLRPSGDQLLWIVDVYPFLLAGSLITMGALGDRIGRRRLLLIGAAAYGIASVLAAYAPTAETLIAARALLGIAGSTLMPSTLALTATMFPEPRRRRAAIGVIVASVSGGTALGPLIGGRLLESFWWGSVFLLGVPVMVLLLAVGPVLLPEHRDPGAARLDPVSVVLSLGAVLPMVYGLKRIAVDGPEPVPLTAIAAGLAVGVVFVRRQRALPHPLLDLGLFTDRVIAAAVGTLALGIFVLWGSNYAIAQYLQLVEGLSPLRAGLWTAPSAAGVIAGSTIASRIRRVGPGTVISAGLALSAAGFCVLTQVGVDSGPTVVVIGSVIVSAGLGPMMALATDLVVGAAPPGRAGAASAISSTAPQLGGALGIAVIGSVITAVHRHGAADAVPAGLPPETAHAAHDTLGGAVAAADMLPGPIAAELLHTARIAFAQGMRLTAAGSAVLMVATAIVTAFLLRRSRPRHEEPEPMAGPPASGSPSR
ncbi:MFS transporter [Actinomadura alba]|uniref:MFS transporter n=1 Tax=Actinomadura alba TaxID=406431 RepID=A0ABR7LN72_9ACTN|nr:MFS transporter [Actinomadura alba]MBC6466128.1 MFS transporter [Actinomadura alba]